MGSPLFSVSTHLSPCYSPFANGGFGCPSGANRARALRAPLFPARNEAVLTGRHFIYMMKIYCFFHTFSFNTPVSPEEVFAIAVASLRRKAFFKERSL